MTLKRFGLGVGALFIVVLVVVAAVGAGIWLMQFGVTRMYASTTVTYDSQAEFRKAIEVVDESIAWKIVSRGEHDGFDQWHVSYKYTVRNVSSDDIFVHGWSDLHVSYVDAEGFAVFEGRGGGYTVPANGEYTHTYVDQIDANIAAQIVDVQVVGGIR